MSDPMDMTEVHIFTPHFKVIGKIALVPGARLTDYIREPGHFIAVADAVVWDRHGGELFRSGFLDVGKDHIEIILPSALIQPPDHR
jgi:hypothetical protein